MKSISEMTAAEIAAARLANTPVFGVDMYRWGYNGWLYADEEDYSREELLRRVEMLKRHGWRECSPSRYRMLGMHPKQTPEERTEIEERFANEKRRRQLFVIAKAMQ